MSVLSLFSVLSAAEIIYKGADKKEIISYYQSRKFFSDSARKKLLFFHPGNVVDTTEKIPYGKGLYRFISGRIYKGFSNAPKDCIATIVETHTKRGDVKEAKIYQGYAIARDVVRKSEKGSVEKVVSFKITRDGIKEAQVPVLFTIKDRRMYKGNSTNAKDCVLNWTGDFNGSRLLFMAIQWGK